MAKDQVGPGINFSEVRALDQAVALVEKYIPVVEEITAQPVLVLLSGLPGTGKSYLARLLVQKIPMVGVESDRVRKILFPQPSYSAEESLVVHRTCHTLIARFLAQGKRVLYDATNLVEFHRELVYRIAEQAGARLIIVRSVAQPEVVKERLTRNHERGASDATWEVYLSMAKNEEPIARPHLVVDTTGDVEEAVNKVLRAIKKD